MENGWINYPNIRYHVDKTTDDHVKLFQPALGIVWKVKSILVEYNANAEVGNRTISVSATHTQSSTVVWSHASTLVIAAGATKLLLLSPLALISTDWDASNRAYYPLPPDFYMDAAFNLTILGSGTADAGDDMFVRLCVEEYFENAVSYDQLTD